MRQNWWKIFWKLLGLNAKEFVRDFVPLVFSLLMPTFFLIVFGMFRSTETVVYTNGPTSVRTDYLQFLVPALLSVGIVNLCLFGTTTPLVAAKEKGILRQYVLIPMPLSAMALSHICVRLMVAIAQAAILLSVAIFIYGTKVSEGYLTLIAFYLTGSVALISCGYALAGVLNTVSLTNVTTTILNFYILAFGQIFIDMREMSYAKWLLYTTPVSAITDLLRTAMLSIPGNLPVLSNLGILVAWIGLAYWIGIRRFRLLPNEG